MTSLLIDAATVNNRTTVNGGWTIGQNLPDRTTSVTLTLRNVCANDASNLLVAASGPSTYETRPVLIDAKLEQALACFNNGDEAWLDGVLKDSLDLALGRALVTQPLAGYGADAVWIGHADVDVVPFTGNPYTNAAGLALAIGRARVLWQKKVVGVDPILHISPTLAPSMFGSGVVHRENGKIETIWGDEVAMSAGYDSDDQSDMTPAVFWTGPVNVDVSSPEGTEMQSNSRINRGIIGSTIVAVIDISPRTIVRVDVTS